jgi:Raf kinase inhibitor-like YbhB/YbcL family protein
VELTSRSFTDGEPIPQRHACDGEDVSPPLAWVDVPAGTGSLALLVDDPDAPGGSFTHWTAWGLVPAAGGLGAGEAVPREGRNDFGTIGYRGPCPPPGKPHRYVFRLHALAGDLDLEPGARRRDVERALAGRTLATAELIGTYERRGRHRS